MKRTQTSDAPTPVQDAQDDLMPEYRFDYRKARPNRFADPQKRIAVVLDEDVARIFTTSETVNTLLRALIETMPASAAHPPAEKKS